jgi:hypothetical protein
MKPVVAKQQATRDAIKNAQSIATRENSAQHDAINRAKEAAATAGRNTSTAARNAGTTVAGATRQVAPPIVGTLAVGFASLAATIWAARPVIPATTVVTNYNVSQRGGTTQDSRNRGGLGPVG